MRAVTFAIIGLLATAHSSDAQDNRCRDTIGLKFAQKLEEQCDAVRTTFRSVCSVDSTCDEMLGFIRVQCTAMSEYRLTGLLAADSPILKNPKTAFCGDYLDVAGDFAPSFDCAKASTATEKMICGERELSQYDAGLAATYEGALVTESTNAAEQQAWLKRRDATCVAEGSGACLIAIQNRMDELRSQERGTSPLPRGLPLAYADLIGQWEVRAVRVAGEGVQQTGDDDPKYMGAVIAFEPGKIKWIKGTAEFALKQSDECSKEPSITPAADDPGMYVVRCGQVGWRLSSGHPIKRLSAEAVRLYWDKNAVLTLKRIKK